MTRLTKKPRRPLILLDLDQRRFRDLKTPGTVLCRGRKEIAEKMRGVPQRSFWISFRQQTTDDVLRSAQECRHRRGRIYGLLTVEAPRATSVPGLTSCFRRLVGTAPDSRFLSLEELLDVLAAPPEEAADLFIAGVADMESETIALTRGNLKTVVVPYTMFRSSEAGVQPSFDQLEITDYGHTIRLGEYEASADAILYEIDPEYRRRTRKQQIAEEKTFGASLRRLRIQRQLARYEFSPLSQKTIARIERNEVEKPHGETLRIIAERLGVEPEEIESY